MLEILKKYSETGKFIFRPEDRLAQVCKGVPDTKSGVYLIYAVTGDKKELIYIGRSGQMLYGYPKHRKGGLRGRFVSGKQQLGFPVNNIRQLSWPKKMNEEGIEHLEVHWYITLDESISDCPMLLEKSLLDLIVKQEGDLPRWNKYKDTNKG